LCVTPADQLLSRATAGKIAGLAFFAAVQCGPVQLLPETESMPTTQQRRPISPFDARSVMLFAALTMGGALAQAQTSSTPAAQSKHQASRSPAPTGLKLIIGSSARGAEASLKRPA
jgi:hypothetical protein